MKNDFGLWIYNIKHWTLNFKLLIILLVFVTGFFVGCGEKNDPAPESEKNGKIVLLFTHLINGEPIQFDTIIYVNEAGNPYLVNEIQYFISDVTLYKNDGTEILIDDWKDIHYVDTDLPYTWRWEVYDKIPEGVYDSVSFTYGFYEEKNISFMFVNPPERDMFWPEFLGGGFHYMKLNGKWLEAGQATQNTPFDFHLGIGQIYYNYPDSITGFIHNNFRVSLPNSGFTITTGQTKEIEIIMNIENWFKDPYIYDHDIWKGYIMQNQDAMQIVKENGHNVFSIKND